MRVNLEPGYLLHARDYRESSLIVEVFTIDHGRLGLIARGVRRDNKTGLQPFCRYNLSWRGRGELPTLSGAEIVERGRLESPQQKLCGLYVNELIIRLMPRHGPSHELFERYEMTLRGLAAGVEIEPELRGLEVRLLSVIGYGLQLEHEITTHDLLDRNARYYYDLERGPVYCEEAGRPGAVSGQTLLALKTLEFDDTASLREAKTLLRHVLDHHLQGHALRARDILQYLNR